MGSLAENFGAGEAERGPNFTELPLSPVHLSKCFGFSVLFDLLAFSFCDGIEYQAVLVF